MKPSLTETEDWKLGCFMDWKPKHHTETCPRCNGKGETGGHFKDLDGPQTCYQCFGSRIVTKGPTTPKPELPPALVEHMRRAWWDYLNQPTQNQQNNDNNPDLPNTVHPHG